MKIFSITFYLVALATLSSCIGKKSQPASVTEIPEFQSFAEARDYLIATYNADHKRAYGLFLPDAVMIDRTGEVYTGPAAIETLLAGLQQDVPLIDSTIVYLNLEFAEGKAYELGFFLHAGKTTHQYLLIWDFSTGFKQIELAIIAKETEEPPAIEVIHEVRASWVRFCNAHDAEALVNNLYAPHAVYYNHKPPLKGRSAISAEYQYMNDPAYSLQLSPILMIGGREDLIFEIGQCSGSYGGKYIIAWQRQSDGNWQVLLDSNY